MSRLSSLSSSLDLHFFITKDADGVKGVESGGVVCGKNIGDRLGGGMLLLLLCGINGGWGGMLCGMNGEEGLGGTMCGKEGPCDDLSEGGNCEMLCTALVVVWGFLHSLESCGLCFGFAFWP